MKVERILLTIVMMCMITLVGPMSVQASSNDFAVQVVSDRIDVSVGFLGSSIELYGSRRNKDADVVIVVEGPRKDITIWQKKRVMGAWINRHYMTFEDMPVYYNYASTLDYDENGELDMIMRYNDIGHKALFTSLEVEKSEAIDDTSIFKEALLERKRKQKSYFEKPEKIEFINDYMFHAKFEVPPSAQTGKYVIHSLLIEDGKVSHQKRDILVVGQVGINAFIYGMANENGFLYAVITIILALFCGWFVSVVKVRP